jgi:nucleoside-diphosphate-sugar epimerase
VAVGRATWIRPYYVFDPVRKRPAVVAEAVEAQSTGTPVSLRAPENTHDFIHAADVAQAILVVVQNQLGNVIPVGSGASRKVRELVAALGAEWRSEPSNDVETHDSDVADTTVLRDHGWQPRATDLVFQDA